MNAIHQRALEYIDNAGGEPKIEWFDDDHEPIGLQLRADMKKAGLITEADGKIMRPAKVKETKRGSSEHWGSHDWDAYT
jgi:hypothetical protein